MIAAAFLILAAQALPAPGSVTSWETLPEDGYGFNFLDPASIRREDGVAHATIRAVARQVGADRIHTIMMRFRIDCRARTYGFEAADAYDADGRLISSRVTAPGTVASDPFDIDNFGRMAARVCGQDAAR
jgi:hypothetical protein